MKSIINFVLRNKFAVWLLTLIVAASGIYSSTRMKMETIPDISIPYLMVMTAYPGATAEEVMDKVSIPIEKTVENLEGVKAVYSTSYAGLSSIQVEYDYEQNMADARRELQNAIDDVTLPDEAMEPKISGISMNMMPVLAFSVSSSKEDIAELTSTVEDILVPRIEKIEGVASVTVTGQQIEEAELKFDGQKLASLGLKEEDVKNLIKANDLDVSLGLFEFKDAEQAVRVDGKFTTVDELKNMLIPVKPGPNQPQPFVRLGDIASVEIVGKAESVSRTNGKEAIAIQIVKAQDANTVTVVNEVKKLMADLEEKIDGLTVETTLDQGQPIVDSVKTMVGKALFGGLIAVLVILLFLRDFKSTLITIISIPVSILLALLLLHWLGITLNLMTLGAITVAIGRVIDDSIVVVENIYRRLHLKEEKLTGRALIRSATIEMFQPILASTLVTVAVFAPLAFVGGMVEELFMPFALTIAFSLGASLLVAITIVPAFSHTLFKKKLYSEKTEIPHKELGKLAVSYKKVLNWALNHKAVTSLIAIVLLVGSLMLTPLIGVSFLGNEQEKVMYLTYTPKAGELPETTLQNVKEMEEKMLARDDVETVQISITHEADVMSAAFGTGSKGALMYVIFDPDTKDFLDVKAKIEEELKKTGHSGTWKSQDFSATAFANNELSYTVYSEDLDKLKETVDEIEKIMAESDRLKDVSTSLEENYDEFTLKVDQKTLLPYGLTTGQIAAMLNPNMQEEVLTTVQKDGKDLEVVIKKDKKTPETIDDLLAQQVQTPTGASVKLSDLVKVEKGQAPNKFDRSKGQYYATVTGTIIGDDVSRASKEVNEKIDELKLPKGVELGETGVTSDIKETFTKLGVAMAAAVAIVYFILVVTFGEGLAPFVILFSLPFAVIGSFFGLWIAGETISVSVMMGLLMLIGIVVTNAIVLVDRIIHMERAGMPMREAILEAGATRLRPILMTAIATVGALIPLLFGEESSGFISKGLGITVMGGLTSSTLLSLLIVPIVYEVLSKLLRKNRKEFQEN